MEQPRPARAVEFSNPIPFSLCFGKCRACGCEVLAADRGGTWHCAACSGIPKESWPSVASIVAKEPPLDGQVDEVRP